jgi:hypothetical protein
MPNRGPLIEREAERMSGKGDPGRSWGPRWLGRRQNWLLEEAGLGRLYNPCLLLSVAVLSGTTALLAVRNGQLEHDAGARTERYIAALGPDYRLLETYKAGVETAVPDGYYIAAARDWLLDVRQRPSGASVPGSLAQRTVEQARKHAWAVTSDGLYERLRSGYWYDADHKIAGGNAVVVSQLTSNIATGPDGRPWRDPRGAHVILTWWETVENTPGSQHYSAVLTFIDQHADRPLAGQNPMGVWVSDFQPTLIEERR